MCLRTQVFIFVRYSQIIHENCAFFFRLIEHGSAGYIIFWKTKSKIRQVSAQDLT